MSATRDRVMSKYPGVIVIDVCPVTYPIASIDLNPSDVFASTQLYIVIDKRPLSDPTVTANQISRRNTGKTIGGAFHQNPTGDTDLMHFPLTEALMSNAYP